MGERGQAVCRKKRCKELIEGPRTRVGQPKMKHWELHELHKNEV